MTVAIYTTKPLLSYLITATFDAHKARRPPSTSPGLDLALPLNTPIAAPIGGRVYAFRFSPSGGRTLIIIDGLERQWWFLHLGAALVATGERLRAGQPVALSGNTGKGTGPHLHLSVRVAGQWVDPLPLLRAQSGGATV